MRTYDKTDKRTREQKPAT